MCVIVYNYSIQTSEGQFWMKLFNKGIKTTSFTHEKTKLSRMHPGSTGAACPPGDLQCPWRLQGGFHEIEFEKLVESTFHIASLLPYLCCETYVKVISSSFFSFCNGPRIHGNKK